MENIMMKNQGSQSQDELGNIILPKSKNSFPTKRFYIILAVALILLLIITIIGSGKVFSSDNADDSSGFVKDETVTIEQDNILNNQAIFQQPENSYDSQTEIDSRYQDILKRLEGSEDATLSFDDYSGGKSSDSDGGVSYDRSMKDSTSAKQSATEQKTTPTISQKLQLDSSVSTPKVSSSTTTPKVESKPVKVTSVSDANDGFYIQVGAFSKLPGDSFISKLKKHNYSYIVTTVNGINKVLIGSFSSREIAERELITIKSDIASGAYITRLK